jgi:hypothetical protein
LKYGHPFIWIIIFVTGIKMIAIHKGSLGFTQRWIDYCIANSIPFKIVDCYKNDIIRQLDNCSGLLWQYYQGSYRDFLMAKSLMNALEHVGIKVFPDFRTAWHFDDKVAQKYLLEALGAPLAPTWVFYDEVEAITWAKNENFPKVLKLRSGAGSQNVKLVQSYQQARQYIHKAFHRGLPLYDSLGSLKERWRKYRLGKSNLQDILEGFARLVAPPKFARMRGREKGYIYFQEFIVDNASDVRVVVIGDKAFAITRMVRKGDFRASGSGNILYDKGLIDVSLIDLSFQLTEMLKSQCVAFDYVYDKGRPLVVEISYGFSPAGYDPCPGYWDKNLKWHEGAFNPYGWMIDFVK